MSKQTRYKRNTYLSDSMESANDRYTYMDDLEACLENIEKRGYTNEFCVKDKQLFSYTSGKYYSAGDIRVTDYYRFEGISNPDDMSILYAIEAPGGEKGTLVDAYGLYADVEIGAFMQQVKLHKEIAEK